MDSLRLLSVNSSPARMYLPVRSPSAWKSRGPAPHVKLVPEPRDAGFLAAVEAACAELREVGLSCMIVDSIFSSDGIFAEAPGFAAAVAAVRAAGGLFIADEVQPGFGRTGAGMWGFARHGVVPDVVTMGKPMGNGYPMAGMVTRPELLDLLASAETLLAATGNAVALCPNYGTRSGDDATTGAQEARR